jgi:Amt family ammonium transporter
MRASIYRAPVALGLLLCPLFSLAQGAADTPQAPAAPVLNGGDTAWIIAATALVLFMTLPGLALFYAGLVRAKNVLSVLMQCFAITCVVSLLWLAVGYSLTFSDGGGLQSFIGGLDKVFLLGVERDALTGTIPETLFFMFQMTFAIITPALVIGGFAERMRFSAVLGFAALWLLLVYVPLAHWVWGGGWLAKLGVMDFAGGIVVHVSAGVSALVCALVLGHRRGFPHTSMAPHSLPFTVTGAGMLWVGWFGFNAGSALAANGSAGMAMLTTHMGASAGALAAVVIGLTAGTVCFFATQLLKRKLHIDDSLDVSPVHGVGGVIGTVLTGVFAATWLGGTGFTVQTSVGAQLGVQMLGVLAAAAWCAVLTWVILKLMHVVFGLRVSEEKETEGLDLAEHGERGYSP